MLRSLIIAQENREPAELYENLVQYGLNCSCISYSNGVREAIASQRPDILLLEMDNKLPDFETREVIQRLQKERRLPTIALIPKELLDNPDVQLNTDDFVTSPYDARELVLRINRLLHRNRNVNNHELIICDGLVIDLGKCEVAVAGRIVELTFKEYELLKLLASNQGRVYTREVMLDKIWGYDYYGGDRTVDVHIRRLRSKIEDATHTFIETVRNIGYRFRKDA